MNPQHGFRCQCSFCKVMNNVNKKLWMIAHPEAYRKNSLKYYYKTRRLKEGRLSFVERRKIRLGLAA